MTESIRPFKDRGNAAAAVIFGHAAGNRHTSGLAVFAADFFQFRFKFIHVFKVMSLRYGTLPIVRETGGLKDTVEPYNEFEGTGTGFTFANYNAHEMMHSIRYAEQVYYDKRLEWNKMVERAMRADFSWAQSAAKYQEMYDWLIG